MDIRVIEKVYRRYAKGYDFYFGALFQPGRKAVINRMHCQPGERILEVGVGTGLSLPMYPASVRITGIDLSREMLERARTRVERRQLANVEDLLEMDAEAMDFPDASFDKVVAMYVVSVTDRPAQLLHELQRVCKPHGDIFIVNHVRSDNPLVGALEKSLAPFANHLGFHPDFELRSLVNGSFRVEHVSSINFFWKVMRLRADGIKTAP